MYQNGIDIIELASFLLRKKNTILKIIIFFFLLGLFIAFGSQVEYKITCKLLPEQTGDLQMNLSGLGGLANLAGVDLSGLTSKNSVIPPDLYPEIVKNTPFQLKLLNQPVFFENLNDTYMPYEIFKNDKYSSLLNVTLKYTIGLPGQIKNWLETSEDSDSLTHGNKNILLISKEDNKIIKEFEDRILVSVDSKTGIIDLSVEMPDANASAELALFSYNLLTEYITDYKISKAQENLNFINERYIEAKSEFVKVQEKLASFNDENKYIVTSMAQTKKELLQNEYNISYEVYKSLANQLEQAKIAVKNETPVFKILEPVKMPTEKYKPHRVIIIISSVLIGALSSLVFIFLSHQVTLKKKAK